LNIHQWKGNIKRFNKEFGKNTEIRDQWKKHCAENMPRFKKENSLWQLEDKYLGTKEKAMVLVGAGPSLKDNIENLKDLDDNFCIVCANSSLKYLLRNGIVPTFCIALDSDDIDIPQHLDVDTDQVTLIASSSVAPVALDAWNGPIYYLPYYSVGKKLGIKMRRRLGRGVPGGGNSMTQAFVIVTILFGSRTVIFVGNEYCFDSKKKYYADQTLFKQETLRRLFPSTDVLGRERWTTPGHYNYVIWQEKACSDLSPPGFFIDTSFGLLGRDCDQIHIHTMSDAIKMVKTAFKQRDMVNAAKGEKERIKIIKEILPDEPIKSDVYRYDVFEQRESMLRLART